MSQFRSLHYLKKAIDMDLLLGDEDNTMVVSRIRSIIERAIEMDHNDGAEQHHSIKAVFELDGKDATKLRKELDYVICRYDINRDDFPGISKAFDHLVETRRIYEKEFYTIIPVDNTDQDDYPRRSRH